MKCKKYIVTDNDPFYYSVNEEYVLYDEFIISFMWKYDRTDIHNIINKGLYYSTYNLETGKFTSYSPLRKVHTAFLKKEKDHFFFFDKLTYNVLIDLKRMEYACSSEYPYCIHIIEGNHIANQLYYRDDNTMQCLTFHSVTDYYETGVFIYDPISNKFNEETFFELEHKNTSKTHNPDSEEEWSSSEEDNRLYQYEPYQNSNKQVNLHKKCIFTTCCINEKIYIVYSTEYNNINDDYHLGLYNPFTDALEHIKTLEGSVWNICSHNRCILYLCQGKLFSYNTESNEEECVGCNDNVGYGGIRFMGMYKDRLIVITGFRNQIIYDIEI